MSSINRRTRRARFIKEHRMNFEEWASKPQDCGGTNLEAHGGDEKALRAAFEAGWSANIHINKARRVTQEHIDHIHFLMADFSAMIARRGDVHDRSKFTDDEMLPLAMMQKLIDEEGHADFGSEEYEKRKALLGPMLDHHYKANSHHPEHYENGVAGMDLFDLVEMFADWKAASERAGASHMGLKIGIEKYGIEPMLAQILYNTASTLGYEIDAA